VQKRAGSRHDDLVTETRETFEQVERGVEVVRPDVAPVDHPGEEDLLVEAVNLGQQGEVLLASAEVKPHALDRQVGEHGHRRSHMAEVGRDDDARTARLLRQASIGTAERGELVVGPVLDEHRFVEAYPDSTLASELGQHLGIGIHEGVEHGHGVESRPGRSTSQQKGEWADQHGHGRYAQGAALTPFGRKVVSGPISGTRWW